MNKYRLVILLLLACFAGKQGYSQQGIPEFTWNVTSNKSNVKNGDVITLTFTSEVPKNWYFYSSNILCKIGPIKPSLDILDTSILQKVGDLISVGDIKEMDEVFDCQIAKFTKTVILKQRLKVLKGSTELKLKLEVQICSKINGMCSQVKENFNVTLNKSKNIGTQGLHIRKAGSSNSIRLEKRNQDEMKHEPSLH